MSHTLIGKVQRPSAVVRRLLRSPFALSCAMAMALCVTLAAWHVESSLQWTVPLSERRASFLRLHSAREVPATGLSTTAMPSRSRL